MKVDMMMDIQKVNPNTRTKQNLMKMKMNSL